jgi:hypothetical protein
MLLLVDKLQPIELWRMGRDLNSRTGYPLSGFQDQPDPFSSDLSSAQNDVKIGDRKEPKAIGQIASGCVGCEGWKEETVTLLVTLSG